MFRKKKSLVCFVIILNTTLSFSQENIKKDSITIYKNIQKYSQKSKLRTFLHKLIFSPLASDNFNPILKTKPNSLRSFQGKIIRKIIIETLDPFGYSIEDSLRKPKNWAERNGNLLHSKTKKFAIRNLLLIKVDSPLDTLLLKESKRLIRTQRYINSVEVYLKKCENSKDSVDVFFRVLDSWSLIPKGEITDAGYRFELNERNIFGSGHNFDNTISQRFSDGKKGYDLNYIIPNYKNTFVRTAFNYQIDFLENYHKSINVDRTFYSPYTKWAGGLLLEQQLRKDSISDIKKNTIFQNYKSNIQDFWVGRSFRIYKGKTKARITNLIISGRFLNQYFSEKPTIQYDSLQFYNSQKLYMLAVGIASRNFVQDKYIFNYGQVEDVPVGKIIGFTTGIQQRETQNRLFIGGRLSFGDYFKFGYLSANLEMGSYFNQNKSYQTSYTFQANYFTNLIGLGKWKMRQFVKPQFVIGSNRLDFSPDFLSINDENGIRGFKSPIFGTQKVVFTIQTQFFSPWNLVGFRINPFLDFGIAGLGNKKTPLLKSKMYTKYGVGFIISNDYLVFNSFQFSLSYYPTIPLAGDNLFKTNAFQTTDFGFQDFDFGKPRVAPYQ